MRKLSTALRGIIRRIGTLLVVLLGVSLGASLLTDLTPGDPAAAALGQDATPEALAAAREQMGLDLPLMHRWWDWLTSAVTGDFGNSLLPPNQDVWGRITNALPVTLQIMLFALILAVVVSLLLALACVRWGGLVDKAITTASFAVVSVPNFVWAVVLALVFAVWIPIFPRLGWVPLTEDPWGSLQTTILPGIILAIPEIAALTQVLRNDLKATLTQDYILAARARGVPMGRVLLIHALKPSMFSYVTLFGLVAGRLLGGAIIVEIVFGLPGLGTLAFGAANSSDFPVVQGVVLVTAIGYVCLNMAVDALYGVLDPRVRRRNHAVA